MSNAREETPRERQEKMRQAFAEAAENSGLPLESDESLENRMVGIALPAAHSTVDVDQAAKPPKIDESSDGAEIEAVLNGFHSLTPAEYETNWEYTLDTYITVGPPPVGIQPMNRKTVQKWLQERSAEFAAWKDREISLTNLKTVYLGDSLATATYFLTEKGQQGKIGAGNGAAMLVKESQGGTWSWKIAVISKYVDVK